jgi:uncharacterized RDD family membrane protein YckC
MSDSTPTPPPPQEPSGGYSPPPGGYNPPPGQQPMAPPPMQAPPGVGQPAELLMRFLARLIDFVLLGIVNAILVGFIVVGVFMSSSGGYLGIGDNWGASAVSSLLSSAIYLGYFTLMESRNGQTVGKMLLKLQTQGPGGGTPSVEQSLKRNAWVALGILGVIPVLGFIGGLAELVAVITIAVTINSSPTRQGWHDNFAGGTKVIKIG